MVMKELTHKEYADSEIDLLNTYRRFVVSQVVTR